MSLRLSLGAGRGRLMRQLVTESLVLAVGGGLAAAAVAAALHRALVVMLAESDPTFALSVLVRRVDCDLPRRSARSPLRSSSGSCPRGKRRPPMPLLPSRNRGVAESARGCAAARGACSSACSSRCRCPSSSVRACWHAPRTTCSVSIWVSTSTIYWSCASTSARRATIPRGATRCGGPCSNASVRRPAFGMRPFRSSGCSPVPFPSAMSRSKATRRHRVVSQRHRIDAVGPGYFTTLGTRLVQGRDIQESDTRAAPTICVINEASRTCSSPVGIPRPPRHGYRQRSADCLPGRRRRREYALAIAERGRRTSNVHRRPAGGARRRQPDVPRARAVRRTDCRGRAASDRGSRRERAAHLDAYRPPAPRAADRAGPGDCPPRARLWCNRPRACGHRSLWRPVLRGGPAHERDRRPNRTRRAALPRRFR